MLMEKVDSPVRVSPDGTRVAFVRRLSSFEHVLVAASLDGSGEQQLLTTKAPEYLEYFQGLLAAPAWSPDGKIIMVPAGTFKGHSHAYFEAVDFPSGKARQLGPTIWFTTQQAAWMPDGRSVLVDAAGLCCQIWELTYPQAALKKITYDLNSYVDPSPTADATALSLVQTRTAADMWIAPQGDAARATQLNLRWSPGSDEKRSLDSAGKHSLHDGVVSDLDSESRQQYDDRSDQTSSGSGRPYCIGMPGWPVYRVHVESWEWSLRHLADRC